jgi:hypothetical protein
MVRFSLPLPRSLRRCGKATTQRILAYDEAEWLLCRLNAKLESARIAPMNDLARDLSDGTRLIELMVRLLNDLCGERSCV